MTSINQFKSCWVGNICTNLVTFRKKMNRNVQVRKRKLE